jgi:hypothetical protein
MAVRIQGKTLSEGKIRMLVIRQTTTYVDMRAEKTPERGKWLGRTTFFDAVFPGE